MMGGAASGSGSGAGSTVFNPVAQPAANAALGNIFQPLADLSANAGAGTPAGINYPMAQSAVYNDIVNSPFANQAIKRRKTPSTSPPRRLSAGHRL
jgi:hypothetical protein